jgi:hypothetical protein
VAAVEDMESGCGGDDWLDWPDDDEDDEDDYQEVL